MCLTLYPDRMKVDDGMRSAMERAIGVVRSPGPADWPMQPAAGAC